LRDSSGAWASHWYLVLALALAWLGLSACAAPRLEGVAGDLPDGYLEFRSEGVCVFARPEDKEFAETLWEEIVHRRGAENASAQYRRDHLDGVADSLSLETPTGRELFEALMEFLRTAPTEREKLAEVWDTVAELVRVSSALTRVFDLRRVKVVQVEEFLGSEVPFWGYSEEEGTMSFSWSIAKTSNDNRARLRDPSTRLEYPVSDFWLSAVVTRSPLPNGDTWRDQLDRIHGEDANRVRSNMVAAADFTVLHETAETYLVFFLLDIEESNARWFHDGMANWLAHDVLRRVRGREAYLRAPYTPRDAGKYAEDRGEVNLLRWIRSDVEQAEPPAVRAHYFYATEELRLLESRHPGILRKLLGVLREQRPVNSEMIIDAIHALSGEDFRSRLAAYTGVP
jgi:hypothetical protein